MAEKNPNSLYDKIKSLQDSLENIKGIVEDMNATSKEIINDANEFGGVIAKVFKEQMAKYFIPSVQTIINPIDNLINGDRVPGSLKDLTIFLDSVPLAMVRQEPSVSELTAPVVPENADIATPANEGKVNNAVDELPANASYANGDANVNQQSAEPVKESKMKESGNFYGVPGVRVIWHGEWADPEVEYKGKIYNYYDVEDSLLSLYREEHPEDKNDEGFDEWVASDPELVYNELYNLNPVEESLKRPGATNFREGLKKKSLKESDNSDELVVYQVVRSSKVGSSLGEDVANLEDQVVSEFDCEDDANSRVEELNGTILPEEKDLLGTVYKVEKKAIKKSNPEPYKEPKDIEK